MSYRERLNPFSESTDRSLHLEMTIEEESGGNSSVVSSNNGDGETIHLSPRERAIAMLVIQGFPNKCIARKLDISHWTVATHLRRICRKLGVSSKTAMAARLSEVYG